MAAGFLAATRGVTIASRRCAISGWRSISRPLKPALRQLARRPAFQVGTWAVSSVREGWYFASSRKAINTRAAVMEEGWDYRPRPPEISPRQQPR